MASQRLDYLVIALDFGLVCRVARGLCATPEISGGMKVSSAAGKSP
jgi:hypothetical protein